MDLARVVHKLKQNFSKTAAGELYGYLPDGVSFHSGRAGGLRTAYFPLCGTDAAGLKSAVTPFLSGDIKVDKDTYLTKPVSVEDLRQGVRNFYCFVQGRGVAALAGDMGQDAAVEAGMLWHKLTRRDEVAGLEMEALNFVPVTGERVELMRVTVKNTSKTACRCTPTFCLPIFGRALSNKHDHEHVTSLLQRITQLPNGVCVQPTMMFDERGHRPADHVYFVLGIDGNGALPIGIFPTADVFYGDGGTFNAPQAVWSNREPQSVPNETLQGKEAVGALRFEDVTLAPGEQREYLMVMGLEGTRAGMDAVFEKFRTPRQFDDALARNMAFWRHKTGSIRLSGGNPTEASWWQWVILQPVLRRIYGCSFLPEHDYGKGGKGWRDLWQDLLSLILIEPEQVRGALLGNFAGVRIDGSNATIIGAKPGEFVADRNQIARVWMDHGAWPLTTLLLYIDQTGDYDILLELAPYFRDAQLSRACARDYGWTAADGQNLKDKHGNVYLGTVLEHVLIQHLVQFFNVGEHNIIRLEDADWNDGLDMARDRGESVAFMSFYGGNLIALADLLSDLSAAKGVHELVLAVEIKTLLDSLTSMHVNYDDARAKKDYLFEVYFPSVQPAVSGQTIRVSVRDIVNDLRNKGEWIFACVRNQETIRVEHGGQAHGWFNGYYDNAGQRVEGEANGRVRMTLTGQVFAIMSGLASAEETTEVVAAVNRYLRDPHNGGIHLNTDFGLDHYLELGRAFGFAYGSKENGAYFSHMTVMYAYALYKRGFVREGREALSALKKMAMDSATSKIYPGIPEYFDLEGRGHYHYLTGSASWLVLTQLTQVFGIRGDRGDLVLEPKLAKDEFDPQTAQADAECRFAGKVLKIVYENPKRLDYGKYRFGAASLNESKLALDEQTPARARVARQAIARAADHSVIRILLTAA